MTTILPAPVLVQCGDVYVVREDLCRVGDANGTKSRALFSIAAEFGDAGIVTAGGRSSTQSLMAVCVANHVGVPFEYHCPTGDTTAITDFIESQGGVVVRHKPGYGSVVNARARTSAAGNGGVYIPTGVEGPRMVKVVANAACSVALPPDGRLVVPVGSGMTLCGILRGLGSDGPRRGVVGVVVGASPLRRLKRYAPADWSRYVTLVEPDGKFHKAAPTDFRGVPVDPHYSGKCVPFLKSGDILWNSGARQCVPQFIYNPPSK